MFFAKPSVWYRWTCMFFSSATLYPLFVRSFISIFLCSGLAFSTQICDELPVTERDMTLDHVISSEPDWKNYDRKFWAAELWNQIGVARGEWFTNQNYKKSKYEYRFKMPIWPKDDIFYRGNLIRKISTGFLLLSDHKVTPVTSEAHHLLQ